jgi:hypothetical protein
MILCSINDADINLWDGTIPFSSTSMTPAPAESPVDGATSRSNDVQVRVSGEPAACGIGCTERGVVMRILVTSAGRANGDGYGAILAFGPDGEFTGPFSSDPRITDPRGMSLDRQARLST